MVVCSIGNCRNSSQLRNYTNKGVTYHSFPKDPVVKDKWLLATGKRNWFPTSHSRLCSVHFREEDFSRTTKRRNLLKKAYPTIDVWKTSEKINVDAGPCESMPSQVFMSPIPESKQLIARVYRYLKNEYDQLKEFTGWSVDLSPLANILKRTAAATGVSEHTVTVILDQELCSDDDDESSEDEAPPKRRKRDRKCDDDDVKQEEEPEIQYNEEEQEQQGDEDIETLKIEYDSEDEESAAVRNLLFSTSRASVNTESDPLASEQCSLTPPDTSDTTPATVKVEPEELDVSDLHDTSLDTQSVTDPVTSDTTLVIVKTESVEPALHQTPLDTHSDVICIDDDMDNDVTRMRNTNAPQD